LRFPIPHSLPQVLRAGASWGILPRRAALVGNARVVLLSGLPFTARTATATLLRTETQSSSPAAPQKAKSGEYVLSRDRYEKAVTYSRSSYIMYFVSVGLDVLALVVFLRLGMAAKYRDWAESVSDKRWIQALIFVPMLVFTVDFVALPLRIYGHVLSLRYEM
jgi:hypothetical protein